MHCGSLLLVAKGEFDRVKRASNLDFGFRALDLRCPYY